MSRFPSIKWVVFPVLKVRNPSIVTALIACMYLISCCLCVCVGWIKILSGSTASQTVRTTAVLVKLSQLRRADPSSAVSSNTNAAAPKTAETLRRQTLSAQTPCLTWTVRNNTCSERNFTFILSVSFTLCFFRLSESGVSARAKSGIDQSQAGVDTGAPRWANQRHAAQRGSWEILPLFTWWDLLTFDT